MGLTLDTIKLSGWEREFCTGAKLILLNKIRSGAADYSKKNRHSTTHSTMCLALTRGQVSHLTVSLISSAFHFNKH